MSWISRLITLPRRVNSFKDIIGIELWQSMDKDMDSAQQFFKSCTRYLSDHPEKSLEFARELVALMHDNARILQAGLSTKDPFFMVRSNTKYFARKWQLSWNG